MNTIEVGTRAHQILCCVEWGIGLGWFGPVSEEKKARMMERVSERWMSDDYAELRRLVADRRLADEFAETREQFALRTGIRIGGTRATKRSK